MFGKWECSMREVRLVEMRIKLTYKHSEDSFCDV